MFTVVTVEHLTENFVLWYWYVWVLLVAAVFVPLSDEQARGRWDYDNSNMRSRTSRGGSVSADGSSGGTLA